MNTAILRTPEERFANLPDFPYSPQYTDVDGLRLAHVEAGPADAHPVLMLHGEPSWSFLYRKIMPSVASAGHRAIAPDLVGCGRSDKLGVRIFPSLVPIKPDDPGAEDNRRAWQALREWTKPFLTAFSDGDPITHGGERPFQEHVPGAQGQPHVTIMGAGHFLQEDKGEELAQVVVEFIGRTKTTS